MKSRVKTCAAMTVYALFFVFGIWLIWDIETFVKLLSGLT